MPWLGEEIADGRTTTDLIEEDLYRRRQELFGEISIAFFDTTSLYFEGAGGRRWDSSAIARCPCAEIYSITEYSRPERDSRPCSKICWFSEAGRP